MAKSARNFAYLDEQTRVIRREMPAFCDPERMSVHSKD